MSTDTKRKPGDFTGSCRLSEWRPADQCTVEQRIAAAAGEAPSRWDHKQRCEVIAIECDETFDNAAAYEKHFLEQHHAKIGMTRKSKAQVGYPGWTFHEGNNQKQITATSVSRSMWNPPPSDRGGQALEGRRQDHPSMCGLRPGRRDRCTRHGSRHRGAPARVHSESR